MFNGNVYVLEEFVQSDPTKKRTSFSKGLWKQKYLITEMKLAEAWVNLNKQDRRYKIVNSYEDSECVEEEISLKGDK